MEYPSCWAQYFASLDEQGNSLTPLHRNLFYYYQSLYTCDSLFSVHRFHCMVHLFLACSNMQLIYIPTNISFIVIEVSIEMVCLLHFKVEIDIKLGESFNFESKSTSLNKVLNWRFQETCSTSKSLDHLCRNIQCWRSDFISKLLWPYFHYLSKDFILEIPLNDCSFIFLLSSCYCFNEHSFSPFEIEDIQMFFVFLSSCPIHSETFWFWLLSLLEYLPMEPCNYHWS